jgi:hypothetical protein
MSSPVNYRPQSLSTASSVSTSSWGDIMQDEYDEAEAEAKAGVEAGVEVEAEDYGKKFVLGKNDYKNHKLFRTKLCKSLSYDKPCHHTKCSFAHSIDELILVKCYNNEHCNTKNCLYLHNETKEEYFDRVGWPENLSPKSPTKPKPKHKFVASAPSKKCYWKNRLGKGNTLVEATNTVNAVKPAKYITVDAIEPIETINTIKSVTDTDVEIVIKVQANMVLVALKAALNLGKTNIRIEVIKK